MENLSYFIHEELFVVDAGKQHNQVAVEKPKYTLSVIANSANEKDVELLHDILRATKIDPALISFQPEINETSDRWLIFSEKLHAGDNRLIPTKKVVINAKIVFLARPLKVLHGSKTDKGALWILLKEEFGL